MKQSAKRSLSIFLSLIMIFSMFAGVNISSSAASENDLTYEIDNGEVTITGCDKNASGELVIPDTIEGYPVTSIRWYAFDGYSGLTSVTIPAGVKTIGICAFYHCSGLTSFTVAEDNENFSSDAYGVLFNKDKTKLIAYPIGNERQEYTIPDSVTTILDFAFSYCSGLTSVTMLAGVTDIGEAAFRYCSKLTSVTIPDGVTTIYWDAFRDCRELTSVTIPDSVTSIYEYAFGYYGQKLIDGFTITGVRYSKAEDYAVENNIPFIESERTRPFFYKINNGEVTIIGCEKDASGELVIPDTIEGYPVTTIAGRSFCECGELESITIPDSVTLIEDFFVFTGCTALTNITVDENNANYSSDAYGVVFNKDKTTLVAYPAGNERNEYTIPDSVTTIGAGAFVGCCNLTSVTIPDSVTAIDMGAFYFCLGLTSITIPDSVTEIGDHVFYACIGLISITIPDSVTAIGDEAFGECSGLTSVTIPDSVISIGAYAFWGCLGLTSVTISDSVTTIGEGAFYNCLGLTSITIPDSITTIGEYAFGYGNEDGYNVEEGYNRIDGFTIIGVKGSEAERYAVENNIPFIEIIDAPHTHDYAEVITKQPSCTENGEKTYTCSGCGDSYTEAISATGHDTEHIEISSTCKTAGVAYDLCLNCGETFNYTVLPLAAHTYGEWQVTKEPTFRENGEKVCVCTVCGDVKTETIAKLTVEIEIRDENTDISVGYGNNAFDGDVEISAVQEFDGESFNILNAEKGNFASQIFDITLTQNGEKVQPNTAVLVSIPIPAGYNPEKIAVYHVTNDGKLEKIESYCENGYICFEATHFSSYAIVDESQEIATDCTCNCHSTNGFVKFFYRIARFFRKLFGMENKRFCACGAAHW